jgi:hypothetical protein
VRTFIRLAVCAAALALVPTVVLADAVEEKNVLSGKAKLDPAQGYIFIQAPVRTYGMFLREPDDATRADYQKDWDEAFAKAQKKYARDLKSWENKVKLARDGGTPAPAKPVEVTRETFSIGPILLRDMVNFGPMFVYTKADAHFTYLSAVKPGTYIYYGPVLSVPGQPTAGQCYCMGTVRFEVKAGQITDLGNALMALPVPTMPYSVGTQAMMQQNQDRAAKGKDPVWAPPSLAFGVPDSLKALPAVPVEFHASGKLNNYFGVPIDRMPPIAGILDYRRDTVIDARTGSDVPNPPIMTQVRIKK